MILSTFQLKGSVIRKTGDTMISTTALKRFAMTMLQFADTRKLLVEALGSELVAQPSTAASHGERITSVTK